MLNPSLIPLDYVLHPCAICEGTERINDRCVNCDELYAQRQRDKPHYRNVKEFCAVCNKITTQRRNKNAPNVCTACYARKIKESKGPAACHPNKKEYVEGLCRSCYRAGARAQRAICHPDKLLHSRGLCRSCYMKEPDIKENLIKSRRLKKYNLEHSEFKNMYDKQNGLCVICGDEATAIDHCHITQKVRGLLCHVCNRGLGMFKDDPSLLQKAYDYLIEHKVL